MIHTPAPLPRHLFFCTAYILVPCPAIHPVPPPPPRPPATPPHIKPNSSFMLGPFIPPSSPVPPSAGPLYSVSRHYIEPYFKLIPPVLSINTFISPRLLFAPLLSSAADIRSSPLPALPAVHSQKSVTDRTCEGICFGDTDGEMFGKYGVTAPRRHLEFGFPTQRTRGLFSSTHLLVVGFFLMDSIVFVL